VSLELELHAQADGRRVLEDQPLAEEWVANVRNARHSAGNEVRYILADCALCIGHVEPIKLEAQFLAFTDRDRIVDAKIQVKSRRRTVTPGERVDGRPTGYTETFVVSVNRVRDQRIERNTRLGGMNCQLSAKRFVAVNSIAR
jgi:hypothetical protein